MWAVWLIVSIVAALLLWLAFWSLISFLSTKSHWQSKFINGQLPDPAPDGFYRGSAYLLGNRPVPWLGKSFEGDHEKGFNIFTPRGASLLKVMTPLYQLFRENGDGNTDAYYFATSTSRGFKDPAIETFKLDYDAPENPFLIRIILDEIVQLERGEYLGKVHMKVFPSFYVTIGYFGLSK